MTKLITRLLRDETGASAIEYALLASLIAIASVGMITAIGTNLSSTFNDVANKL